MKNTSDSHHALPGFASDSRTRPIHLWILAALVANALLLCVVALQIKQVGSQLTVLASQNRTPGSGQYAHAGMPLSENPYSVSFAKNESYNAYRVSSSDPIPVKIVGTPIPVEVKNAGWNAVPVEIKR